MVPSPVQGRAVAVGGKMPGRPAEDEGSAVWTMVAGGGSSGFSGAKPDVEANRRWFVSGAGSGGGSSANCPDPALDPDSNEEEEEEEPLADEPEDT